MSRRTDTDGETIITSEGFDEVDPESLVEPTELPLEEIEEAKEKLTAKAKLYLKSEDPITDRKTEYEGTLMSFSYGGTVKQTAVSIKLSLEAGLDLLNFVKNSHRPYIDTIKIEYVWKEHSSGAWRCKINHVSIGSIENGTCLCTVISENMT